MPLVITGHSKSYPGTLPNLPKMDRQEIPEVIRDLIETKKITLEYIKLMSPTVLMGELPPVFHAKNLSPWGITLTSAFPVGIQNQNPQKTGKANFCIQG